MPPVIAWLIFVGSIMLALYALGVLLVAVFDSIFSLNDEEDDELSIQRRKKEGES